jgi:flagellar hook-length control protein FliK
MENMQFQIGSNTATAQTPHIQQPVSTLAVLSMMDAHLRTEDIEALKNEFDSGNSIDTARPVNDNPQPAPQPNMPTRAAAASTQTQAAPAFADNPDMAQTYDKLSQKLTTELAARMHEKLNAGEWKMKFALKPASLGLVDVQLEMKDGKLSAHFQSDTNLTQDLLQNGSQRLKDALADLGMNNASVFVAQGQAQGQGAQGQSARSGKFTQGNDNGEKLSEDSGLRIAEDPLPRRNNSSQFDSYA